MIKFVSALAVLFFSGAVFATEVVQTQDVVVTGKCGQKCQENRQKIKEIEDLARSDKPIPDDRPKILVNDGGVGIGSGGSVGNGAGSGGSGGSGGVSVAGGGSSSGAAGSSSSSSSSNSVRRETPESVRKAYEAWQKKWQDEFKRLEGIAVSIKEALANRLQWCIAAYGGGTPAQIKCSNDAIADAENKLNKLKEQIAKAEAQAAKELAELNKQYNVSGNVGSPTPPTVIVDGGSSSSNSNSNNGSDNASNDNNNGNGTTINNNNRSSSTTIINNYGNKDGGKDYSGILGGIKQGIDGIASSINGLVDKLTKAEPQPEQPQSGTFDSKNDDLDGKAPTKDLSSFDVTNYFASSGTCPPPYSVNLGFLGQWQLGYDWFCKVANAMRGVVIGFAWLAGLMIIVKGTRRA